MSNTVQKLALAEKRLALAEKRLALADAKAEHFATEAAFAKTDAAFASGIAGNCRETVAKYRSLLVAELATEGGAK